MRKKPARYKMLSPSLKKIQEGEKDRNNGSIHKQ